MAATSHVGKKLRCGGYRRRRALAFEIRERGITMGRCSAPHVPCWWFDIILKPSAEKRVETTDGTVVRRGRDSLLCNP